MAEPLVVLYIAGIGRNGSTLLSRLLGAIDGVENLGEFASYWTRAELYERHLPCGCGRSLEECPRWSSWNDVGLIDVEGVDRVSDNLSVFLRRPSTKKASIRVAAELANRYRRAAEQTGARFLVDASKRPALAQTASADPAIDIRLLHMTRDPKSVAQSRTRAKEYLRPISPWRTAMKWTAVNLASEKVGSRVDRTARLRYEDLASAPLAELARLLAEIEVHGVDLPEISGRRIDIGEQHSLAGNPDKLTGESVLIRAPAPAHLDLLNGLLVKAMTGAIEGRYGY